jgi:hypothetical protein
LSPRSRSQAIEEAQSTVVSTKGQSSSSDSFAFRSSEDGTAANLSAVLEGDRAFDNDAEKILDSEEGALNSSYANINLFQAVDINVHLVFNHGLVPLKIWPRSHQLYCLLSGRIKTT